MTYKYPKLVAIVAEIAARDLDEIEVLKLEIAAIEIEKAELKRNIAILKKQSRNSGHSQ